MGETDPFLVCDIDICNIFTINNQFWAIDITYYYSSFITYLLFPDKYSIMEDKKELVMLSGTNQKIYDNNLIFLDDNCDKIAFIDMKYRLYVADTLIAEDVSSIYK